MKFDAFREEKKPLATVQLQINRRAPVASKFYTSDKEGCGTGRRPYDIRSRWDEPIPPFHEQFKLHYECDEMTESAAPSTKDHDNG